MAGDPPVERVAVVPTDAQSPWVACVRVDRKKGGVLVRTYSDPAGGGGEARPGLPGHGRSPLRRLSRNLIVLVVFKLAVLMTIWYVAIRPLPRADVSPAGVGRLLAPASASSQGTSP
ncbi:cytochrome oxidase putative small subunit CydP [Luteibacter yeojuensis]|uniref:cytochrome oxidase putative small subunit CydP n=1 Tax=Luteibacter yeojuensis TaxID=345309 RepID=UPI00308409D4